jgi:hypothetical protein
LDNGRCPSSGKTRGEALLEFLKILGCFLVIILLLGLLGRLLKDLGFLPDQ